MRFYGLSFSIKTLCHEVARASGCESLSQRAEGGNRLLRKGKLINQGMAAAAGRYPGVVSG